MSIIDERLKNLKCDCCGSQAEKWYGFTSFALCNKQDCYRATHEEFLKTVEESDEL